MPNWYNIILFEGGKDELDNSPLFLPSTSSQQPSLVSTQTCSPTLSPTNNSNFFSLDQCTLADFYYSSDIILYPRRSTIATPGCASTFMGSPSISRSILQITDIPLKSTPRTKAYLKNHQKSPLTLIKHYGKSG